MGEEAFDINLISRFLAEPHLVDLTRSSIEELLGQPADLGILLGSAVLQSVDCFAEGIRQGAATRWMIVGGIGHSTQYLVEAVERRPQLAGVTTAGLSEASILTQILRIMGIDEPLLVEDKSTNCGSNAIEAQRLLDDLGIEPKNVILIQDPTMMRRSNASFRRVGRGRKPTRFINCPPFVPYVVGEQERFQVCPGGVWGFDRFIQLVLGEITRLRDTSGGYGPMGRDFIEHVDIPEAVERAFEGLSHNFWVR